jgi:hypothetical protein
MISRADFSFRHKPVVHELHRFENLFTIVEAAAILGGASLAYLLLTSTAIVVQPWHTQNDPHRSLTAYATKRPDIDGRFHVQFDLFKEFIASMTLWRTFREHQLRKPSTNMIATVYRNLLYHRHQYPQSSDPA